MVIAVFIFATVIFIFTEWITNNIFLVLADTDFPIFRLFCNAFDICVEKNSELEDGDPRKKYKGRVVFLGDTVRDEDGF